jgi:hypothetical protein
MDKLNPTFQATPVTPAVAQSVSSWYATETTMIYTSAELPWLQAQGWRVYFSNLVDPANPIYFLIRRVIKPELVVQELVTDYTTAYNEGRQLNDQRYDDLLTLYTAMLDRTEDELIADASDGDTDETAIATLIAAMQTAFSSYAIDVDGFLDDWGDDLLAEINARFDAESSKADQSLLDRGLYTGLLQPLASAGVERERTRALNNANDLIMTRQLELKSRVYDAGQNMRERVLTAYERLRARMSGVVERRAALRNAAAEALGRLVERREDGYPELSEIGRLAASLGAGSAEAFAP